MRLPVTPSAYLCFFMSGAAGLVYEVCWIRQASMIFGSTTAAVSTVVAVFFAGLGIGSYAFGRIGQRTLSPLRYYSNLELLLALYALISPTLFASVELFYAHYVFDSANSRGVLVAARAALVAIVLLPPAIIMGGTLPLFCRQLVSDNQRVASSIAFLYGINTSGAVVGCVATGFYLIPALGVTQATQIAALINFLAAVTAAWLSATIKSRPPSLNQKSINPQSRRKPIHAKINSLPNSIRLIGLLAFLAGFVALGSQVLWVRFLALIVRNSVYTYTITLSVILTGIVLGSLGTARLMDRWRRLPELYGTLQIISALIGLYVMLLPAEYWRSASHQILPLIALMLIPSIISGACFPLINRLAVRDAAAAPQIVGHITAINIFGGVAGSLLTGFYFLPHSGLHNALLTLTGVGFAAGAIALVARFQESQRPSVLVYRWTTVAAAALIWFAAPAILPTRLPHDFLGRSSDLVDVEEGLGSTLSVDRLGSSLRLKIDRLWQGTNTKNHQMMAAHIPAALSRELRRVLLVGVGVGQTASRFLYYDIDALDVVDIEPAIFPFIQRNFDSAWIEDPRVRLIPEDGRIYIDHSRRQYDVISVEVGQVFRPGIEAFYTVEFYRNARARLHAGGLIAQFVPLAFFKPNDFQRILSSFRSVFPDCVLWYNTQEMLLLGAKDSSIQIDPRRLARLFNNHRTMSDLRYSHWGSNRHWLNRPEHFLAGYLSGSQQIAEMAQSAPVYHDDIPSLTYSVSDADASQHNEIALAQLISKNLSPVASFAYPALSAEQRERIRTIREINLSDLSANAYLVAVSARDQWAAPADLLKELKIALQLNPYNAMANRMTANAYARLGRLNDAKNYFEKALDFNPEDSIARRELALIYGKLGRIDDALREARVSVQEMPHDAAASNILGLALISKGSYDDAIVSLNTSIRLDPDLQTAQQNLALAKKLAGR